MPLEDRADEVQGMIVLLGIGGTGTVRSAISFGVHALLQFPEQMDLFRADPAAIMPTAIEEIFAA